MAGSLHPVLLCVYKYDFLFQIFILRTKAYAQLQLHLRNILGKGVGLFVEIIKNGNSDKNKFFVFPILAPNEAHYQTGEKREALQSYTFLLSILVLNIEWYCLRLSTRL